MKTDSILKSDNSTSLERLESNDKAEKRADKDMELIFDDYFNKKLAREKQADERRQENVHQSLLSKSKHEIIRDQQKHQGQLRDDDKIHRDLSDLGIMARVGMASDSTPSVQHSSQDGVAQSEPLQKLSKLVNDMLANNLSQSSLQVRISGVGKAEIDIALSRSKGQLDVFISSNSEQTRTFMANTLTGLEEHMRARGHDNVRLSVVR